MLADGLIWRGIRPYGAECRVSGVQAQGRHGEREAAWGVLCCAGFVVSMSYVSWQQDIDGSC